MKGITLKHWLAGAIMLAAAAAAVGLKPTIHMAEQNPINLEQMIPQQFGDWKIDQSIVPVKVDPELQARLNKIYSQLVSRTYVNQRGDRVMLSISYGADQSDALKVHRPEVCYPSQGFEILKLAKAKFVLNKETIPVTKLVSKSGNRVEPLMYWVTVGDQAVDTGLSQKLAQIKYGVHRVVPDGLLFRVSTINEDILLGSELNESFTRELLFAIQPDNRKRLGVN